MRALDGLRVVDFGQYVGGPLAALMLADQGAQVTHVDPPGGPRWKHPADAFYNRGKQRITLDLTEPGDRGIAERLLRAADVVIENFRPRVMDRLGFGPDRWTAAVPSLIYCSIPGFARDDPRAGVAAWEGVVGAATDTYAEVGQLYPPGDPLIGADPHRPVFTALPLASNFAAFHAATAIVMALIARERDGLGQMIEVPMFDAMFELIGANGISVDGAYPMTRTRGTGTQLCGDGRRILFNSVSTPRFARWFAEAADGAERSPELFLTRSAQAWEDAINAAGGPTTRVRTPAEWLASDQARQRRTVVQVEDPLLGPTWMAGSQVHQSDCPEASAVFSPRHLPDADRAAVLAELELTQPRLTTASTGDSQTTRPGALDGIRVLDLTQVVAGPCTGRILGEYGADVIKINNPFPGSLTTAVSLSGRPMDPGNQQHEHLNRGKLTLLLDLHSAPGLDVFDRLVDQSDVLMQNFALGMADRYGIGYPRVHARHPRLVYFSLSAYGYGGPMQTYRGFEPNAQAVTGLMHRFGGDGPPMPQPYLLDDYGTGVRGAFAVGLGIYHRLKTGRGQHINISLAETATYHQGAFLMDYPGKVWDEPRGTDALGSGPPQRLYRASDGWFFLGTSSADLLAGVPGLEDLAAPDEPSLERCLAQAPAKVWVERLRAAGIGAACVERVEDLMHADWVRAHGLSLTQTIEGVGDMVMPGFAARLSGTPLRIGHPVHPVGADAPEILARLGLQDALDTLIEARAIAMPSPVVAGTRH